MKTTKEQVIELLETEINEVETGHEVYSRNETARVLSVILGKVKDIQEEEFSPEEKIEAGATDLKLRIQRTIESFSFDFSFGIRNGNEIDAEIDNLTDLSDEIDGDIDTFVEELTNPSK